MIFCILETRCFVELGNWDDWVNAIRAAVSDGPDPTGPEWVRRQFGRPAFEAAYRGLYRELGWSPDEPSSGRTTRTTTM